MKLDLPSGAVTGIGPMPHIDARAAVEAVLTSAPRLPFVPSLPRAHPAASMIGQLTVGVRGLGVDADGALVVDPARVDPLAAVRPDLGHPAFAPLRTFCEMARGHRGSIKWQIAGPNTFGTALLRRGLPPHVAYDIAVRIVRRYLRVIHQHLAAELPHCQQLVFIDEPALGRLQLAEFPMVADAALDIASGALATVEHACAVGLHCCRPDADLASLLAVGPQVLSVPVRASVVASAGFVARFLEHGGWFAWGVVPTDGPVGLGSDRYWRELSSVWSELVRAGCDADRLRRQSLVTPTCGLAQHDATFAAAVLSEVADVADKITDGAVAARLSVGA